MSLIDEITSALAHYEWVSCTEAFWLIIMNDNLIQIGLMCKGITLGNVLITIALNFVYAANFTFSIWGICSILLQMNNIYVKMHI